MHPLRKIKKHFAKIRRWRSGEVGKVAKFEKELRPRALGGELGEVPVLDNGMTKLQFLRFFFLLNITGGVRISFRFIWNSRILKDQEKALM